MRSGLIILAASGALMSAPAAAQDSGADATRWTTGLVGIASTSIYDGADTDLRVLPNGIFRVGRFSVGASGLAFSLFGDAETGVDLILAPRFAPYDMDDSPALAGMDRDFSADAGVAFRLGFGSGTQLQGRILQEVTSEHEGQEVDLRVTQSLREVGWPVALFGGVTWQSAEMSEFLYGVRPGEALATRPAYAPGDTLTPYIGVSTRIPINDTVSLFGSVQARFLDDDITASPIVVEDTAVSLTIGVNFNF